MMLFFFVTTIVLFPPIGRAFPFHDVPDGDELHTKHLPRYIISRPEDLLHIKNWAALGDSYAAGIGAGKRLGNFVQHEDWLCSRWDAAYPVLMNEAEHFGEGERDFKFLACSGWTSSQIKEEQVPKLDDESQQLITLSAGGNDVYLSDLLDACVYQISPGAALYDKCQEMIDKTSHAIDNDLGPWLNDLYNALKPKLRKDVDAKIYQTGYAQFWNAGTDQCDGISWRVWEKTGNWLGTLVYLTKDRRKQMNDLAVRVNNKIKETIAKNGHSDKIVFVDVDPYVALLQGRFCEPGIEEPAKNRPGLLFYNRGTTDGDDDGWKHDDLKRTGDELGNNTFEGQIASKFETALKDHPDWKLSAENPDQGQMVAAGGVGALDVQDVITTLLPDTFKRIFHPRPYLHGIYAQLVLFHIANDRSHLFGNPYMPQALQIDGPNSDSCKWEPAGAPRALECFARPYEVAKEKTADGSTSVLDAIEQFCKKRHGEKATADNFVYDRWDISGFGITKRQSMWLRASPGLYTQCGSGGPVWERDCIRVLTGALNECNKGSSVSHGFKAQGENCLEYMVDMSASLHEGDPPWNQHVIRYPPPETVKPFDLIPFTDTGKEGRVNIYLTESTGQQVNWDNAFQAINDFCKDDRVFSMDLKPAQFGDIRIHASPVSQWRANPRNTPYEKDEWCGGVDVSKMNSDDCKYGFRRLLNELKNHNHGVWFYRCVSYLAWNYPPGSKKETHFLEGGLIFGKEPYKIVLD